MLDLSFKTYIVSLKGQDMRRSFISNQLESLNIDYEFFNAINPSEDSDWKKLYKSDIALESYGRHLSNGELGCNLSHHFIYQDIVNKNIKYSLILEDDALINNDLPDFINSILNSNLNWDVIILGYSKVNKEEFKRIDIMNPIGRFLFKFKNYKIGKVCKNYTVGTVGYLISKEGAKKLVDSNLIGACLADNWEYYYKKANLDIYHCRPFLIYEDFENFESSISAEREKIARKSSRNFLFELIRYMRGYIRQFNLWFLK